MASSKSSPARVNVALRRAKLLEMRADGEKITVIRDTLGYRSNAAVYQDIGRALAEYVGEPAAEVRAMEVMRLDELWREAIKVMRTEHLKVSHGKVIYLTDDKGADYPLADDAPVLQSIDRLLKIQERRAKLLGLDAPTKVAVITDAALDEEYAREQAAIAELERQAAAEDSGSEDGEEAEG